ncbi:MAG: tRNA (adenosine(37)-N6)-threonylcarbamoyltransferase complex dimerization subunit type 1 TsaB [Bacillota bacterium]|jgi:tRNA threonylcarbamoyladenosine biosynthesis protein TsaB
MRLLAIDAATKGLGLAVAEDDRLLASAALNVGKTHSQRLLPLLDDLLREGGLKLKDIDTVAVTVGPGSFTGLRIGISTAKAIAYAIDAEIVGVKTLDALAQNCLNCGSLICPILDARRNEVYYGIYSETGEVLEGIGAMEPRALAEHIKTVYPDDKVIFLGDAADIYIDMLKEILGDRAALAAAARRIFMAESAAFYAIGHISEAVTPQEIKAFYLRASSAERMRKAKTADEKSRQAD